MKRKPIKFILKPIELEPPLVAPISIPTPPSVPTGSPIPSSASAPTPAAIPKPTSAPMPTPTAAHASAATSTCAPAPARAPSPTDFDEHTPIIIDTRCIPETPFDWQDALEMGGEDRYDMNAQGPHRNITPAKTRSETKDGPVLESTMLISCGFVFNPGDRREFVRRHRPQVQVEPKPKPRVVRRREVKPKAPVVVVKKRHSKRRAPPPHPPSILSVIVPADSILS